MNWLTYTLGVKSPENTTLEAAELGFRGLFVGWMIVPIVLLIAIGVFLLYFRERGRLGAVRRSLLAVLRVAVLVLVLLLMFRPVLLTEFKGERPRGIVVLIDNSESMKQKDHRMTIKDQARVAIAQALLEPGADLEQFISITDIPEDTLKDPARVELVKAVLTNDKLKLLNGLSKHGPLRPYLFGEKLYSVVEEAGAEKEGKLAQQLVNLLDATQEKTALANHVLEILNRKDGDLPAALVLVTDGQANADYVPLTQAAEECKRLGVPLYIYGVGSTEGGLLQLTDVPVKPPIFYKEKASIPIHWKAQGFKKGTVQITMTLNGKEVAKKELPVQNGDKLREELELIPQKHQAEKNKDNELVVNIELKDNPLFKDQIKQSVYISDEKLKVLYIENLPRWEYKFLQPLLMREEQEDRIEARFILAQASPGQLQKHPFLSAFPPREELFKYDLVILGDVPSSFLGKKNMELIQEYVRDFRGGLIVIAGDSNMPADYDNTPIAEILPVEFLPKKDGGDPDVRPVEYKPELTRAGEAAKMLDLTQAEDEPGAPAKDKQPGKDNLEIWKNLPGFYWHYDLLTKLKPGATPLLVHPRKKLEKEPLPIMAMHHYGKGQVLFLATDETWRWRKNEENKYFAQFWGQVIYQLALPHHVGDAAKTVKMSLEPSAFYLHQKGYVYAHLLDEKFQPIIKDKITARRTHLDTETGQPQSEDVVFHAIPGRPGEYRLLSPNDQPGRFEVKIPGMDFSFQYAVKIKAGTEQEEAPLAEESLSKAAYLSGGGYYREENLHQLAADVQEKKTTFTLHQEILLWNPLVFLIFVGLITAEWVLRKFSNLS